MTVQTTRFQGYFTFKASMAAAIIVSMLHECSG